MQTYRKIKYGSSSILATASMDDDRYQGNEYNQGVQTENNSISAQYKIGIDASLSGKTSFLPRQLSKIKACVKTARLYQWAKNILLFLPVCFLSQIQLVPILHLCVGFLMLGLTASSVYFVNDVLDKESDKLHPRKKFRPIAQGIISSVEACVVATVLLVTSVSVSFISLGAEFSLCIGCYFGLTLLYSLYLKKTPIMDVIVLACLYNFRIYMGTVILGINLSMLVYACSFGGFLSLALLKRSVELTSNSLDGKTNQRRGYLLEDKNLVTTFGSMSGFSSILFMVMYFHSSIEVYKYPQALWVICLGYMYWLSYMWLMTGRDRMHDDPVFFATTNTRSYIILVCMGISWIVAKGMVF